MTGPFDWAKALAWMERAAAAMPAARTKRFISMTS
jgi:hypothetical protein